MTGSHEVDGSIPFSSTKDTKRPDEISSGLFVGPCFPAVLPVAIVQSPSVDKGKYNAPRLLLSQYYHPVLNISAGRREKLG